MPAIDINDMGSLGVVRDVPAHMLPPEAWSSGTNVRIIDDSIGRLLGYSQIFGTPGVAPYHALYLSNPSTLFWLYAGLGKIYVYNGSIHTDITRASGGDYNALGSKDWNSTILGGIPILNNGSDIPQFWSSYSVLTKMANLTNWPSTLRARVIRSFGPYLMALNTTVSAANSPHNMRWSHPADPGSVPSSWDITDTTKDAGSVDFPDVESGIVLDGLPLQGRFYVYKEGAVWMVRLVGGRFIFDEVSFLDTIGLLCTRAVCITPDGKNHVFMAQDNLWVHNGNDARPLLDKTLRRTVFSLIDITNYAESFIFSNPVRDEIWFCYPENGQSVPTRTVILNTRTWKCTEGECDFTAVGGGTIQTSDTTLWSTIVGTWAAQTSAWAVAKRRQVVICKPSATKFELLDDGATRDSTTFTGTVQRTGLGIIGRKRTGEWIEDFEQRKLVTRIWPKISGGAVSVRMGSSDTPDGSVTWLPAVTFDPTTQKYVDYVVEGTALAIEFSGATQWKLDGYKLDMELTGNF